MAGSVPPHQQPYLPGFSVWETQLPVHTLGQSHSESPGLESPCYLITDTHYPTFRQLMERTPWEHYVSGQDPRCSQCMMHCGYEPTVIRELKGRDLLRMIRWNLYV